MLTVLFVMALITVSSAFGQKLKPEEIVAKHLASIGTAEKLASVKTLIAVGQVDVQYLTQKNLLPASGRIVVASEGNKTFFGLQLNASDYPQEKFIYDGSKFDVAMIRAGSRSPFGEFVQGSNGILSGGILAGAYKTSWPLLSAMDKGAKISSGGSKKINDREALGIKISPKGKVDAEITMYFDEQTFQHVRTEYTRTSSAMMGRTIDESARQLETRVKVTEDYSDFKEVQGLTLPHKYKILYSVLGAATKEISYTAVFMEFAVNQPLDPGTFALPK